MLTFKSTNTYKLPTYQKIGAYCIVHSAYCILHSAYTEALMKQDD